MVHVSATPVLALRGVSKRFGAVQALTDVELEVHGGEVVALVGDNGAGKSTLVKTIAGVHPIDEGAIEWEGKAVSINKPHDAQNLGIACRRTALAPQLCTDERPQTSGHFGLS
ncbi:ATP-binding cassette domain-containing protein, partial [Streptomyces sp. SYSU K21746]